MLFDTLAIVGVGLIGGSVGRAVRERHIVREVVGIGRNAESLSKAQATGAIDRFTLDLKEGLKSADMAIFCTAVDQIARQVRASASSCKAGIIITDVGSTKANIVRDLEGALPSGVSFVGSHPLAGSEKRGPEHASADLFEGRITIVTRTAQTDEKAVERVAQFWRSLGSEVCFLDPESHDQALALTSHLPHLAASVLAGLVPEQWLRYTATGFRDTTRIASGDATLWSAIFRENALAMCDALHQVSERLDEFRAAILNEDDSALIDLLSHAKRVRDALGS